jgi:hypothetical protein
LRRFIGALVVAAMAAVTLVAANPA